MDARPSNGGELAFRPEVFFLGRTEGAAVVRDMFGRVQRRCQVVTEGARHGGYSAVHFDETFTYDDGQVDVWRWALTVGSDGRYIAAEALAGSGMTGHRAGEDYVIAFNRPTGAARGLAAPRFVARFTLLAPEIALMRVRFGILGLPVGEMDAVHRRVGSA